MTRYFLKRLQIEGFRGINNEGDPLDLRFKTDAVNSVFAWNGLGKSSIFDALSYAIRRQVPKLDVLNASERARGYYGNCFHSTNTSTIAITLSPDDSSADVEICVQHSQTGLRTVTSPTGHPEPELLLGSLNSAFILVDHRNFLHFVEDSPLDRGRTFSSLLGLGEISEVRQALETLSNMRNINSDFQLELLQSQHSQNIRSAEAHLRTIRRLYHELLAKDLVQPFDPQAVAAEITASIAQSPLLKPYFAEDDIDSVHYDSIRNVLAKEEASDKRDHLANILRCIPSLENLAPAEDEQDEIAELRATLEQRDAALANTRGPLFANLYQAVLDVVASDTWHDPHQCPACESKTAVSLADAMRTQLQQYATASRTQTQISRLWESSLWVNRLKCLEEKSTLEIPSEDRRFSLFDQLFRTGTATPENLDQAVAWLAALDQLRHARIEQLQSERSTIVDALPPSLVALVQQIERAYEMKTAMNDYRRDLTAALIALRHLQKRQRWQQFITEACRSFSTAETALSTALTTSIEAEYRSMYLQITNNPNVVPTLKRAAGSEELHLRLRDFHGLRDVSATTLLSESYRNALAISIFLSAALKSSAFGRFIVLDDVTSSFDAGHQFDLMELLRTKVAYPANPDGPQIIMLSHDGLLEKYFDRHGNTTSWHHQRLQGLPPRGNILSEPQSANRLHARAVQFLQVGRVEDAEPLIRQYLEFKLLEIIRCVAIPVPLDFSIRDDRKMVDSALKACREGIAIHAKAATLILTPKQIADVSNVHIPAIVGNWVAHYATGVTSTLSPYVLRGILVSIDEFAKCFQYTCTCTGQSRLRYYKSLSAKRCSC